MTFGRALEHGVTVGLVGNSFNHTTETVKRFLFHLITSVPSVLSYSHYDAKPVNDYAKFSLKILFSSK
jgi:hypothetical protein